MDVISSVCGRDSCAVPIPASHAAAFGLRSGLTMCQSLGLQDTVWLFLHASDIQKLHILFQSHSTILVSWSRKESCFLIVFILFMKKIYPLTKQCTWSGWLPNGSQNWRCRVLGLYRIILHMPPLNSQRQASLYGPLCVFLEGGDCSHSSLLPFYLSSEVPNTDLCAKGVCQQSVY